MITIKKNPNGDTRTAPKTISYEQFQQANDMHRADVSATMLLLSSIIAQTGANHDYTKKSEEQMFYDDFKSTLDSGTSFVDGKWYNLHITSERHHLLSHCPDDVNLIDVFEMIADCVCAGMARSGEIRSLEINDVILQEAVKNTVKLIHDAIVVESI
jgi:hypothetical protein